MSGLTTILLNKVKDRVDAECESGSISGSERILSVIAGGFILGSGIRNVIHSPLNAVTKLTLGGALVFRGIRGNCPIKKIIDSKIPEPDKIEIVEHRYFVK